MLDPIVIEQVVNGYIVNLAPRRDMGNCISSDSVHVFESMESLQKYIRQYFEPAPEGGEQG